MKNKNEATCMHPLQRNDVLRVASRTSNLALIQVKEVFLEYPGIPYRIIPIQSFGDNHKEISLIGNLTQDFFTRELDEAIARNEADVAIHSAKDLPYPIPDSLEVVALFPAFDRTDSLVSIRNLPLRELPDNPRVGTSSILRKEELLQVRPDIQIVSIRGTIEERIQLIDEGKIDAAVIATCALKRLGLTGRIAEVLPFATHPLQGHLAVVAKKGNVAIRDLFQEKDIRKTYGKVWLIGFGPGDPGLLTIKARDQMQAADIIFYDNLINHDFLKTLPAEKVYVGKRKDLHSHSQSAINRLLVQASVTGKNVVRLKGGDPMLFAHGGEELEYLHKNLINTEVIPGITAALAASAYAKIPLTYRGRASMVTFLTGHSVNEVTLPSSGTLVLYMGASTFTGIAQKMMSRGWSAGTPVMMVYNVSATDQQEYLTTLGKAADHAGPRQTPLIILIGEVVKCRQPFAGENELPSLLVTGTEPGDFSRYGIVHHSPFINLIPLEDYSHVQRIFHTLGTFQWLIFTSRYAVKFFFKGLHDCKKDIRSLANLQIASIGISTSAELDRYGIIPELQPACESSRGLINLFEEKQIRGQQILIPRSDQALGLLPEGLKKTGNNPTLVTVYHNVIPDDLPVIIPGTFQYIVFCSPSGVENFFSTHSNADFRQQKFIVQGNVTMNTLKNHKIPDDNIITKQAFISASDSVLHKSTPCYDTIS